MTDELVDTSAEDTVEDTVDTQVQDDKVEETTDKTEDKVEDNSADKSEDKSEGYWPDDWRQNIAGDDSKLLEQLGRYATPADVAKGLAEARKKISEGVKPVERPEASDADAMAEYRKQMKLPETPEAFLEAVELPDEREIGEEDKPLVEAFAKRYHEEGRSPADLAVAIDEYYRIQEDAATAQSEADSELKRTSESELREEWGGDYKANVAAMRPYFETVNQELFDNLMTGRMADGSKIGDNPDIVRFFVAKALQENPAATVVPAGANQLQTIQEEISKYEKIMSEDRDAWFKDKAGQERYRELLEAQEKLSK